LATIQGFPVLERNSSGEKLKFYPAGPRGKCRYTSCRAAVGKIGCLEQPGRAGIDCHNDNVNASCRRLIGNEQSPEAEQDGSATTRRYKQPGNHQ